MARALHARRNPVLSMTVDDHDFDAAQDRALPSVEMTMRFLALCDRYCSHEEVVAAVARGRRDGVCGLPECDAWPEWNTSEMRAAVEYLSPGTAVTDARDIAE